jgi:hypothetical protein
MQRRNCGSPSATGGWGAKFRRQVPVGPYIIDFLCIQARLVIELDGGQHGTEADALRDAWLRAQGYVVLRFWNNDVLGNLDGVLQTIAGALRCPHPNPLPQAGEGVAEPSPACGRGQGEGGAG